MHGQITIHVPGDTKANVLFRTHRGVIMSNFDDKVLVAKTTVTRVTKHHTKSADARPDAAAPSAPAGATPAVAPEKPEAAEKAEASDGDWHDEVKDSIREAAREAALAAQDAAMAVHEGLMEVNVQMSGVIPPLPPMTGGKVVTGTLNGGGTQIQAATLNGDIVLKRVE